MPIITIAKLNLFNIFCTIFLSTILIVSFSWGNVPRSYAQESVLTLSSSISQSNLSSSSYKSETKVIETTQFNGDITRKDGDKLYVTKDNTTKEFVLPQNIAIKKDTLDSTVEKLQVGDNITVKESSSTGAILSIEATSKQILDYSKFLIPGVLALLALAAIIWYLSKKLNNNHIQTNNVNRN